MSLLTDRLEQEYLKYLTLCKHFMVKPHTFDSMYGCDWLYHMWELEKAREKTDQMVTEYKKEKGIE